MMLLAVPVVLLVAVVAYRWHVRVVRLERDRGFASGWAAAFRSHDRANPDVRPVR